MKSTFFSTLFVVNGTAPVGNAARIAAICLSAQVALVPAVSAQTTKQATASFNADIYRMVYPDVAKQIKAGKFKSALDHYEKVGQSGKDAMGCDRWLFYGHKRQ